MGNIIKVDFSGRWSQSLDQLIERHIKEETFPGIEILFAQGPEILLHKAWGRQEAGSDKSMGLNTVFDIASLTKPVATTSLIMLLQEQGMLDLEEPVATFLPEFDNGAKSKITLRHLLTHMAGWDGDLFHDTGCGEDALSRYATDGPMKRAEIHFIRKADGTIGWLRLGSRAYKRIHP